jgi:hypothetical protein
VAMRALFQITSSSLLRESMVWFLTGLFSAGFWASNGFGTPCPAH